MSALRRWIVAALTSALAFSCASDVDDPAGGDPPAAPAGARLVALARERFPRAASLLSASAAAVPDAAGGYRVVARREVRRAAGTAASPSLWRTVSLGVEAELPAVADGVTRIGPVGDGRRVVVRREGTGPASAGHEDGVVVYPGAGVDVFVAAAGDALEELLLVHGASSDVTYVLEPPPGSTLFAANERVIEVREERGSAWLRLRVGRAWDANGQPVRTRAVLEEHRVRVVLDEPASWPVLVDPAWETTASMLEHRESHTATLLPSGRVLIAGGWSCEAFTDGTCDPAECDALGSAEIFDPSQNNGVGSFTMLEQSMHTQHAGHTATRLGSGKVLLAGGREGHAHGSCESATTELFDEAADGGRGAFVQGPVMNHPRSAHAAARISLEAAPGGEEALLVGGSTASPPELYVFKNGEWTFEDVAIYDPKVPRYTSLVATSLEDGDVLLTGGKCIDLTVCDSGANTPSTYTAGLFKAKERQVIRIGNMTVARRDHTATLLDDGHVLVLGGRNASTIGEGLATAEIYHPANDPDGKTPFSFTSLPTTMNIARYRQTATKLANGWILIAGGPGSRTAELFDPIAKAFVGTEDMPEIVDRLTGELEPPGRLAHDATLLGDSRVLITGGVKQLDVEPVFASALIYGTRGGAPCNFAGECLSGHCVDEICCDSACGGCGSCATGTCRPFDAGTVCNKEDSFVCSGDSPLCPDHCDTDDECDPRHFCSANKCDLRLTCRSTVDCADGFRCNKDRVCVPDKPTSSTPAGCNCHSAGSDDGGRRIYPLALLAVAAVLATRRRDQNR